MVTKRESNDSQTRQQILQHVSLSSMISMDEYEDKKVKSKQQSRRSEKEETASACRRRRNNGSNYRASSASLSSSFSTFINKAATNNKVDDMIERLQEAEEFVSKVKELKSKRQGINSDDSKAIKRSSTSSIPSKVTTRKNKGNDNKSKSKSNCSLLFECFGRISRVLQKRSEKEETASACRRRRNNGSAYRASSKLLSSSFATFISKAAANDDVDDIIKQLEEAEEIVRKVKELGYSPEDIAELVMSTHDNNNQKVKEKENRLTKKYRPKENLNRIETKTHLPIEEGRADRSSARNNNSVSFGKEDRSIPKTISMEEKNIRSNPNKSCKMEREKKRATKSDLVEKSYKNASSSNRSLVAIPTLRQRFVVNKNDNTRVT